MTERWYISVILLYDNVLPLRWKPVIPADLSGCHVFSYSLASGVRLPVTQMEIWCSTGLVLIVFNTSELVPAWILMQFHEDESNMSSAVLVYNPVSESPCPGRPVWTPRNLIYDWQLIWKSQNTPAWLSERDSVDEKTALARFVSQPSVWPRRPAFICLHTLPPQKTH